MVSFKRATKAQARLRLALAGPAGAGKTYTALTIATHLAQGGPIALVDTERGSASKYAGLFTFDVLELESFHPNKYIEAIHAAQTAGYVALVIDSLSHAWMGKDGALELVDRAAKKAQSNNSFGAWREVTPLHNALVDAMLGTSMHLIVTLRSKQEYVQEKDDKGRTVIRKVGLAPVQRDGLEYEFDVYGDLTQDNDLIIGKTRCPDLAGQLISKPGKQVAETLLQWLTDGAPLPPTPLSPPPTPTDGNGKPTMKESEFSNTPEGRAVEDERTKLLRRYSALTQEATRLRVQVHPIPDGASIDQITDLGLDLKNRIDEAKARSTASRN